MSSSAVSMAAGAGKRLDMRQIDGIIAELRHHYDTLDVEKPVVLAFSGGKDSSLTVDIFLKMLRAHPDAPKNGGAGLKRPVHLFFSDTGLEFEPLSELVDSMLDKIQSLADKYSLPVFVKKVMPEPEQSFYYLTAGAGYRIADRQQRYCTTRWKVDPQHHYFKELFGDKIAYVGVTGQRKDESPERREKLERTTIDGMHKTHEMPECHLLTPIEDLTTDQVWEYLLTQGGEWLDADALLSTYLVSGSLDTNECNTVVQGAEEGDNAGCSKSLRSGCIFCGVNYSHDAALEAMAKAYPYMVNIWMARQLVFEYMHGKWHLCRDLYQHGRYDYRPYNKGADNPDNNRYMMASPGGYSLEHRERMLTWLLTAEKAIREGEPLLDMLEMFVERLEFEKQDAVTRHNIEFAKERIAAFRDGSAKMEPRPDYILVPQDQLEIIAPQWIKEGDLDEHCKAICAEYGREVHYNKQTQTILSLSRLLRECVEWFECRFGKKNNPIRRFIPSHDIPYRFYGQAAASMVENENAVQIKLVAEFAKKAEEVILEYEEAVSILDEIAQNNDASYHFYPSDEELELAMWEWKEDKPTIMKALELYRNGDKKYDRAKKTLFGYEGKDAWFWEKKADTELYDPFFDGEHLSLEEKYEMLDDRSMWGASDMGLDEGVEYVPEIGMMPGKDAIDSTLSQAYEASDIPFFVPNAKKKEASCRETVLTEEVEPDENNDNTEQMQR